MTRPAGHAASAQDAAPAKDAAPVTDAAPAEYTAPAGRTAAAGETGPSDSRLSKYRGPGSGGPSRYFFSAIWLVYLIAPVTDLFGQVKVHAHGHVYVHHHGVLYIVGGLLITAIFCVIYLPIVLNTDRWPSKALAGVGGMAVLVAVACTVYGRDWTPLWIYVSAAAGLVLTATHSRRQATYGVVAIGVCYTVFCALSHQDLSDYVAVLLPVLLVGLAMIGFRMQMTLMRELAQARGTVARLAANEERLRLARDMHDLTGQSLSMITLKSELAAKRLARLPESPDRDSALTELGDIGTVSRQTLHDIREAVSGYRRPTLAIEVITARNALEAAGIELDDDAELTLRSGSFAPASEAVLAWCLREAVTNVIRHSGARHCQIRLTERRGELSLDVSDDGRGLPQGAAEAAGGSGLRGMSERLSAVGGCLSLSHSSLGHSSLGHSSLGHASPDSPDGAGFRLIATVPMTDGPAGSGHNSEV